MATRIVYLSKHNMNIKQHHNKMQYHRRRKHLQQNDILKLCDIGNQITVSRYEHGERMPTLRSAIAYHLILDVPMEQLFPQLYQNLYQQIMEGAELLKVSLSEMNMTQLVAYKNQFLEDLTNRIGCLQEIHEESKQ